MTNRRIPFIKELLLFLVGFKRKIEETKTQRIGGWQNTLSQNMPLSHKDYFELQALEKHQIWEGHSISPFPPKTGDKNSHMEDAFPVKEETKHFPMGNQSQENSVPTDPVKIIFIFL